MVRGKVRSLEKNRMSVGGCGIGMSSGRSSVVFSTVPQLGEGFGIGWEGRANIFTNSSPH